MKIKKMIYQKDRKQEILYDDTYLGYRYIILNLGTHPTAYIEIPEGHQLCGKSYDDIDLNVHGGLTYGSFELLGIDSKNYYIGWDYAHYNDYSGSDMLFSKELRSNGKKWTTEEIITECKSAIQQIVDMSQDNFTGWKMYQNGKEVASMDCSKSEDNDDLELLPEDELYEFDMKDKVLDLDKLNFNFRVLKDKINELAKEINEIRRDK